jgi:U4/U6.U5 tri-snRNP-associated protein 2
MHSLSSSPRRHRTTRKRVIAKMSKRQADLDLEAEADVRSPASKKPRFAGVDTALDGRDTTTEDDRNGHDAEVQETEEAQERAESPDDLDEALSIAPQRQSQPIDGYSDLYLDTINRAVLDFDFEKLCSISLSNINVYACLVCGKYFQGRGNKSHAYFHALEVGHHVFVNMETKKVYVLPEGYEVKSKSLDDIKYVVDPTYAKAEVMKLDKEVQDAWGLLGKKYRPGQLSYSLQ